MLFNFEIMTQSKKSDIRITNDFILKSKKIKIEKEKENWLGHTGQAGGIDYGLLEGGTLEELRVYSNSNTVGRVYNQIKHLIDDHDLDIPLHKQRKEKITHKFQFKYKPTNSESKEEAKEFLNPPKLNEQKYIEGKPNEGCVTKYERDPKARKKCIEHYGYSCSVCSFNFEKVYGEVGKDFIHVHHLQPVSTAGEGEIDPIIDLRSVCPNCHAMIHRRKKPFSIEELKEIMKNS
ncbi:MAG TPA: hypothetical protein DEO36_10245 [Flavobacteriaceae bacterium]|jgi:predicted HNH restriction endonuclease|nr:hypothetical protein [Flavobacteriaceae bacterium]